MGPEKFCCVITDNANVMKASWAIIEDRYPHISANGCAAHVMNLLVKGNLEIAENAELLKNAEKIVKFVTNHHIVKGKFEERRKAAKVVHTLTLPVVTRWFSRYSSLRNLQAAKYVLLKLADDEGDLMLSIKPKQMSSVVVELIKSSDFWDQLSEVLKTIEFPVSIIGKFEADDAPLSLVYEYFGKLYNHDEDLQKMVADRMQFLYTDSMGLAYMFTPKFAAEGFYFDNDKQIIGYAKAFALKNMPEIAEEVKREMISYVTTMSRLPESLRDTIFDMDARSYWSVFGRRDFPSLYKVAKPVTEMVCSSAASGRGWSTFKFIHTRLRNRLSNERVMKLVFLYTNCAMLDEIDKFDYIFEDGAVICGEDCEENDEE